MKNKKHNPSPLMLTEGLFTEHSYDSFEMLLQQGPKNWKQGCPFQLGTTGLSGQYQALQLCSMQIGYGKRKGSAMYSLSPAKDSFCMVLVIACKGKSCFDRMKCREGDILFFDDSHPHSWITDCPTEHAVVTIQKSALPEGLTNVSKLIGHSIFDTDARLLTTLYEIRKRITDDSIKKNTKHYQESENEILTVLARLLSEQTPTIPKLTAGEKAALDICDKVFGHMDGNMSISSLAKEYNSSEQTLQNSFKSLFGYTPKHFFRLLKLNLVHQELKESNPSQITVLRSAQKWGFMHMGHFNTHYMELFGENPSVTLKTSCSKKEDVMESCAERQEEMN